jgi:hypothetical protein
MIGIAPTISLGIGWQTMCSVCLRQGGRMKLALSIVCLVALGSSGLGGQSRPDFSGTWSMDLTRSEAAAQGNPIGPVTVAIRQMPEELRIDTTRNGKTESVRYLPASVKATGGDELLGAFRWEGSKLVTTLVTDINKQAITVQEVRSLDPAGREMSVELTLVVEHGYQSGGTGLVRSQNSPNTSKGINVFVKTP